MWYNRNSKNNLLLFLLLILLSYYITLSFLWKFSKDSVFQEGESNEQSVGVLVLMVSLGHYKPEATQESVKAMPQILS